MAKEETNYDEMAVRIYNWMCNMGYVHDYKKHTRNTVTVDEIVKEFRIKLDDDGEPTIGSYKEWQHIKLSMIQLGYPIAVCLRGHYIGEQGDQGTNISRNVNFSMSVLETAKNQMEAVKTSGKSEPVTKKLDGRISQIVLKT